MYLIKDGMFKISVLGSFWSKHLPIIYWILKVKTFLSISFNNTGMPVRTIILSKSPSLFVLLSLKESVGTFLSSFELLHLFNIWNTPVCISCLTGWCSCLGLGGAQSCGEVYLPFLSSRGRCRSSGPLTQTATGGSVDCSPSLSARLASDLPQSLECCTWRRDFRILAGDLNKRRCTYLPLGGRKTQEVVLRWRCEVCQIWHYTRCLNTDCRPVLCNPRTSPDQREL